MQSIHETFAGRRRLLLFAGATAFVAGVFLVGVGTLSVAYGAISDAATPAAAVLWAPTVTGLGLAGSLAAANLLLGGPAAARLSAVGVALSVLGVALVWVFAPATPPGTGTAWFLAPAGVYVLGTLALLAGFFSAAVERPARGPRPAVGSTSNPGPGHATVADGGDEDDHLTFLLDRDDEDDGPDRL